MLDTLNRYVQGSPGSSRSGLQDWRPGAGLDPRWPAIVTLSIVGHVLFYAAIIALDWWVYHLIIARHARGPEQVVQVTVLTPPGGQASHLRAPPEHVELIDLRHLKLEAGPDDTKLVPRSANAGASMTPGTRKGGDVPGSGADTKAPGQPDKPTAADERPRVQPPGSRSIQSPEVSAVGNTMPATLSVPPAGQPPVPSPNEKQQRAGHEAGESGDDGGRSNRIGLKLAQSRYVAYVRGRIYTENQRIMPRHWIESTLASEVVSEFSVVLERSGRVRAVRLVQSCGYSTLDQKAREAISLASPFDGFPPELGDTFEMTVDVHYTPFH